MSSVALWKNCSKRELRTVEKYRTLAKKRDSNCGKKHVLGDMSKLNSLLLFFTLRLGEGVLY